MIIAGLLAGKGVYDMAERVIKRYVNDSLVKAVWVLTPRDRFRNREFMTHEKIFHINEWVGADDHNKTGRNRERIRLDIASGLHISDRITNVFKDVKWIVIGDEDGLPDQTYFEYLDKLEYDYPVLLTGKTFNLNGTRWFDWCGWTTEHYPFCIPYDSWDSPRWGEDKYCSGNQHVFNRAGFALNVAYEDIPGEDPHYCRAFRKAGGKLEFRPELSMTLQKLHCSAMVGNDSTKVSS